MSASINLGQLDPLALCQRTEAAYRQLKSRDVSLLASDAVNDVQPSGVQGIGRPVHLVTQVNMGLPLVDNAYTEDAALEAARLKRWELMLTLQIHQIPGGTASP